MPDFAALTPRERDILRLYPKHGVHKLIAHELGISTQTVRNHLHAILAKTDCASLGQAAIAYDRWLRTWKIGTGL